MKTTIGNKTAALEYAKRGWAVMPLKAKKKDPHFDLIKNAYLGATTDEALIEFWFDVDPTANIGIACITSNLVVFDVDFRNGGEILEEFGQTYTVQTGDGFHYYYQVSQSVLFKGSLEPGIDIKHKGYVAAAPSIHPNGKIYTVINDMEPAMITAELLEMGAK
jgi:hypothetical protein